MRGKRLSRLLQLIPLLRGARSWNARRLADHFRTSRRNIYRDLAILELAGVPYHFDPEFGEGGGYRIRPEWWFPNIGLTQQECLDLAVLTRIAEAKSIPLLDDVCEVRDKLLATLPTKQQELIRHASELFEILSLGLADHSQARKNMLVLQNALLQRKQIEGVYASPHQKRATKIQLQPRRVFLSGSAWYLAAHDNKSKETKLYRVPRFRHVQMLDRPMTIDPTFSLREFMGNAWTVHRGDRDWHVEIRFDADSAPFIRETHWHHTQDVELMPDGSLIFRATVAGLEEIKYWVLGWGDRAKVLRPVELVQQVRDLVSRTADLYLPSPTSSVKTRRRS